MPGTLGVFGAFCHIHDKSFLLNSIDLLSNCKTKSINFDKGFVSAAWLSDVPLKGDRILDERDYIICFVGDMVGKNLLPWHEIINSIQSQNFQQFQNYEGNFAIVYLNKNQKTITIVSDRRSQQPFYYKISNSGFLFSSEMATFCRLADPPVFNQRWLYEFFFFNFPIFETTFVEGVYRIPPASVFQYSLRDSKVTIVQYAPIFRRKPNLLSGTQAFELAADIFKQEIPKYFWGADETACSLTSGWDGRTLLALAPDIDSILAYTYGVPGCQDLIGATKTAKRAGLRHRSIPLNNKFLEELPNYMLRTVFLSSGLQNILRSSLLYVYETLTNYGQNFPLIISGIGLDDLFRGLYSSPHPITFDIEKLFQDGKIELNENFWSEVLRPTCTDFSTYIKSKLEYLLEIFGKFTSPEHHLLYKLYLLLPQHYAGEIKIAEQFSTLRMPSCDSRIIDLAFSIENSTLSFSAFKHAPKRTKNLIELQSYLLKELSPRFAKLPIMNTRPDIALKGHMIYYLYTFYRLLLNRISSPAKGFPPLENWTYWLNTVHKDFMDRLIFSQSAVVREYITPHFLEKIKMEKDYFWAGKLASVEIILRLLKNRWTLFDIRDFS